MITQNTDKTSSAPAKDTSSLNSHFKMDQSHLEELAHETGQTIGSMANDLVKRSSSSLAAGRNYVKNNPAKGVAWAASAGALLGSLVTMALRTKKD